MGRFVVMKVSLGIHRQDANTESVNRVRTRHFWDDDGTPLSISDPERVVQFYGT